MSKMKLKNLDMLQTISPMGVQAIVDFGKYELSIVQNEMSYGNKQGLYEIAVFSEGNQVELPGITSPGDSVKGFLTESDVNAILTKMHTITGTEGTQI
jgi:hypothetical protein